MTGLSICDGAGRDAWARTHSFEEGFYVLSGKRR
jgi:hypothetical protein